MLSSRGFSSVARSRNTSPWRGKFQPNAPHSGCRSRWKLSSGRVGSAPNLPHPPDAEVHGWPAAGALLQGLFRESLIRRSLAHSGLSRQGADPGGIGLGATSGGIEAPGSHRREARGESDEGSPSRARPFWRRPWVNFSQKKLLSNWCRLWQWEPPSSRCRADPGKAPRPWVGSGFDRDPGGRPVRWSCSYVPLWFRRTGNFVDLGFECFANYTWTSKERGWRFSPPGLWRRAPRGAKQARPSLWSIGTRSAPELGPRPVDKNVAIIRTLKQTSPATMSRGCS